METDDFTWLLFRWKPPDVSGRQARGFGFASFNDLTRKSMEGVSLTASKSVNVVTGISHTHTCSNRRYDCSVKNYTERKAIFLIGKKYKNRENI